MILIQQNETTNPKVASTRAIFAKMVRDKHEDGMAKFGAAVSQGIIDAGGRNVTITLQSKSGSNNMPAIVGMVMFTQFWYWFPCTHMLSLAFTPTAIIGVNKDLQVGYNISSLRINFGLTLFSKSSRFLNSISFPTLNLHYSLTLLLLFHQLKK